MGRGDDLYDLCVFFINMMGLFKCDLGIEVVVDDFYVVVVVFVKDVLFGILLLL